MNNRIGDNLMHFGSNEQLVRALTDAGVKFIVIGGLAVAWYCPDRQADDMDLLVDPSAENSALISTAFARLGLSGFTTDSFAKPGLQVPLKGTYHAEPLTPQHGSLSFAEVEANAVCAKLFGIPVRLADVSALIAMKQCAVKADRATQEKHLIDIALLEKHVD